ncbi:hypothetical protein BC826DRAFT_1161997 [Russula brevipes]|nr:hypothetical protein BC826DRAFT_1161997 [Russula brevipes]
MGDRHRDPRYQPNPHQAPSSSTRNQPKHSIPPPQTTQGAYSNPTSQHERARQPQASGRTDTHSSSAPAQTVSIPTTGQHGQIGQYSSGYSASAGSSGSHHAHAAGRPVPIGTALNMLPGVQHPVGGHPTAHPQPQDWNTTGHGGEEHRSSFQPKGPRTDPSATHVAGGGRSLTGGSMNLGSGAVTTIFGALPRLRLWSTMGLPPT